MARSVICSFAEIERFLSEQQRMPEHLPAKVRVPRQIGICRPNKQFLTILLLGATYFPIVAEIYFDYSIYQMMLNVIRYNLRT